MSTRHRRLAAFRPFVHTLEDRTLLSAGTFVEDFQDDANPGQPAFDSSGLFQHSGSPTQIADAAALQPPSPPHAFQQFSFDTPHRITFNLAAGETVDYAGVWVYAHFTEGGCIDFVGERTHRFDISPGAPGWGFRDTTGLDLGPLTEIRLGGFAIWFDDVTVRVTGDAPADTDTDGVLDVVEDGAANEGDGNGDGILDRLQARVASFPNAEDQRYVSLISTEGTQLANVQASKPQDAPTGVTFPVGLFAFDVRGIEPGGTTEVELLLPRDLGTTSYYRFGPTPDKTDPHWYSFRIEDGVGARLEDGQVTLHFQDGGFGDDDLVADGRIVDGGGPGGGSNSIHGVVWNDLNGNGVRNGEPGLPGIRLFLDLDNDGRWSGIEPIHTTDAAGAYSFTSLAPDTYGVGYVDRSLFAYNGYLQTAPQDLTFGFTGFAHLSNSDAFTAAVVQDFDGNGWADVAYAATERSTFTPFRNVHIAPDLGLGPSASYLVRSLPVVSLLPGQFSLVSADFNADGLPDLATSHETSGFSILLSQPGSPGTFQVPADYGFTGTRRSLVAAGDFDADGLLDLVATGVVDALNHQLGVWTNSRSAPGTYNRLATIPLNSLQPASLTVGDFNSDGLPDLAGIDLASGQVFILFNDPSQPGSLLTPPMLIAAGQNPSSLATADVDADGLPDLVAANSGDSSVSVLLNTGQAGNLFQHEAFPTGQAPTAITVGDFNGDGLPDLATANTTGPKVSVLLNDAASPGDFLPPQHFQNNNMNAHVGLVAADLNHDTLVDLLQIEDQRIRSGLRTHRVEVAANQSAELNFGLDPLDRDQDSIDDSIEDGGPNNGDGNDDGLPDSQQAGVVSLPSLAGNYVTFEVVNFDAALTNVRAVPNPSPQDMPPGVEFPWGFFEFEIRNMIRADGGAEILVYFHDNPPRFNTFWKYGPEWIDLTNHWYEFRYDRPTDTGAELSGPPLNRALLHFVDGQRGDDELFTPGVIRDPIGFGVRTVPLVESIVINDGSPQRFRIKSITVSFSDLVSIDPKALLLKGASGRRIGLDLKLADIAGQTVATITFDGRRLLADGRYALTIKGDRIHSLNGRALDADADGVEGGKMTESFFALFGDSDGDGDVDQLDRAALLATLGKRRSDAGYLWYFDWDENGIVNGRDAKRVAPSR